MARQTYQLTIAYDGTPFAGFQVQPGETTVQGELERALKLMSKGENIPVVGSGRTDAGVHARGQVIHFSYPADLPQEAMLRALNSILPTSIRVLDVQKVEKYFHARYHAQDKTYCYKVSKAKVLSPFARNYVLHHPYRTDLALVARELDMLVGEHNFQSFCSTKTDKTNYVRTIKKARLEIGTDGNFAFWLTGNGFLYHMVRIIVGTALQIGDGLRPPGEMARLLALKDRTAAGPTAQAHGLYLMKVTYMDQAARAEKTVRWLKQMQAKQED